MIYTAREALGVDSDMPVRSRVFLTVCWPCASCGLQANDGREFVILRQLVREVFIKSCKNENCLKINKANADALIVMLAAAKS